MNLRVGDHAQVPKVSEGTCTGKNYFGVGHDFQVLKVSEGTCTGKVFSGMGDHFQVPRRDMYLTILRTYLQAITIQ